MALGNSEAKLIKLIVCPIFPVKSINISAKSMYWEAYGMRETNKNKAREIFTLLTKTLMPANEYFVKSRIALEDLN